MEWGARRAGLDGKAGVTGAARDELNTPVQAAFLTDFPDHPGFHVLITDQGNARVILVDLFTKDIVWQYGTTGVTGSAENQLNNPNSVEVLENGNVLIADENNNRAIEITPEKHVVHVYSAGGSASGVASSGRRFGLRGLGLLLCSLTVAVIKMRDDMRLKCRQHGTIVEAYTSIKFRGNAMTASSPERTFISRSVACQ